MVSRTATVFTRGFLSGAQVKAASYWLNKKNN
jgi:hypothetical protein